MLSFRNGRIGTDSSLTRARFQGARPTVCIIVRPGMWTPPGNPFTVVLLSFLYFRRRLEIRPRPTLSGDFCRNWSRSLTPLRRFHTASAAWSPFEFRRVSIAIRPWRWFDALASVSDRLSETPETGTLSQRRPGVRGEGLSTSRRSPRSRCFFRRTTPRDRRHAR